MDFQCMQNMVFLILLTQTVRLLHYNYQLKSDPGRPNILTALVGGPGQGTSNPNIPIPMGAFTQDYEYIAGSGDLDECNGRFGVTLNFQTLNNFHSYQDA